MLRRLPSPTVIFVAVLAVVLVCITIAKGLYDPDYFWHLTTGRLIATTGHVPSTDPFSFTWAGQPWTPHEWLGELLLYWAVTAVGATGAMVVFGLVAGATFSLLALALRRAGVRTLAIAGASALCAWVLVAFLTVRPQAFSWLFLAGLLAILMALRAERPAWALTLVPYFALWANVHGLWVIGLGVVALYLMFTFIGRTPMAGARRWMLGAAIGCVLATMATPAGPIGVLYPLRYIQPGNWGLANIQEWQSPNFHDAANWGFLALVLVVLVNAGRGTPGWLQALALVGIGLGLTAVRNDPIAAVFAMPTLAFGLEDRLRQRQAGGEPRPMRASVQMARRLMELTVAVIIAIGAGLIILPASPMQVVKEQPNPYPAAAVDTLMKMKPDARVLAEYGWGGYVISRMYDSGGRVFVDGRNDMYSEKILNDYSAIRDDAGDWIGLTKRYGVEAMLFPGYVTIVKGIAETDGWCEAFRDDHSVLVVKDCSLLDKR